MAFVLFNLAAVAALVGIDQLIKHLMCCSR